MTRELGFRLKIPLSVTEEVGENTVISAQVLLPLLWWLLALPQFLLYAVFLLALFKQVNIGTAYLNRGYFTPAQDMYKAVLDMEADRKTALKGSSVEFLM